MAGFFGRKRGEEPEGPAVDADDRNIRPGGGRYDSQQGAIAADYTTGVVAHERIKREGEFFDRLDRDTGVAGNRDEIFGNLRSARFLGVDDKSERTDRRHEDKQVEPESNQPEGSRAMAES